MWGMEFLTRILPGFNSAHRVYNKNTFAFMGGLRVTASGQSWDCGSGVRVEREHPFSPPLVIHPQSSSR